MQKFQEEQVVDTYLHKEQLAEKDKKPDQDDKFGQVLEPGGIRGGLKDIETKEVDLSRILFQMIISINPMQMATVLYNDVSDEFLYRIYRPKDGSVYEKTISSDEINCHPVYKQCIEQGKFKEVGERVAKHYLNEIMIESVLEFSNLI